MKHGKMLKISDERTIFIIENEDGSYISPEMEIKYRNIGESFDTRFIQESFCAIEGNMVNVLDAVGNTKFHFPAIWLDTTAMQIETLIQKGILKHQ